MSSFALKTPSSWLITPKSTNSKLNHRIIKTFIYTNIANYQEVEVFDEKTNTVKLDLNYSIKHDSLHKKFELLGINEVVISKFDAKVTKDEYNELRDYIKENGSNKGKKRKVRTSDTEDASDGETASQGSSSKKFNSNF